MDIQDIINKVAGTIAITATTITASNTEGLAATISAAGAFIITCAIAYNMVVLGRAKARKINAEAKALEQKSSHANRKRRR